jgi:hypothetical protein
MDVNNTNTPQILASSVLVMEMVTNQRKNIPSYKKLAYKDLKRIVKYINNSIFSTDSCCLWDGYITNSNATKNSKGVYVNFYFKKKKIALHRILYENFKGEITDSDYIRYTCENKGQCCNINHMIKVEYTTKDTRDIKKNIKNDTDDENSSESSGEEKFSINFN